MPPAIVSNALDHVGMMISRHYVPGPPVFSCEILRSWKWSGDEPSNEQHVRASLLILNWHFQEATVFVSSWSPLVCIVALKLQLKHSVTTMGCKHISPDNQLLNVIDIT